jgi:hypothetical protein
MLRVRSLILGKLSPKSRRGLENSQTAAVPLAHPLEASTDARVGLEVLPAGYLAT